jgi:hypothetical protein
MNKTKGFLLAAAVAAIIFTFSCGEVGGGLDLDGDGSSSSGGNRSSSSSFNSNGACYFPIEGYDAAVCATFKDGQLITRDLCSYVATVAGFDEYQYRDSCPPNPKLICEEGRYYYYCYGSAITPDITCEMLFED